ncbi:aspartate aminotransferase family protein [Streptomyces sp. NBC_01320]|uniref:aspartate aminotransferase family protein n=1 Tax=Streptomyces sp. NBC_01320 TaxID=2903824 RepID=UPI002E14CE24|nr:diaminobutyrate--2-oxoglutarate transaminase family protein [Streptomyces sp. NBC_01320]WSK00897.1 diaminobutyrate--2-oxoglutarate transaminase family protein [Streptomyces sp. NBC_01320]
MITPLHTGTRGPVRPHVAGELPGPRSAALLARQEQWESRARTYPRHLPIALAEGSGSFVQDVDGNVFIDFLAGAGVLSLGHNHPEIVRSVIRQLSALTHGLDFPTPVKDAFTQAQLSMLSPRLRTRMKVHFCGPTGANAVEAALKLCKTATGRGGVIAFRGGFHGSTHGAMAVSGLVSQKTPVHDGMPGVHFLPYGSLGPYPAGPASRLGPQECADQLEQILTDSLGGVPLPAAVIVEVVQGEGGVVIAHPDFLRRVRVITRALRIPLIVDEVQTGCGRTGTWFAFEQYGIEPDVIVLSKALTGIGIPVSLILYDAALDTWAPGAHIGTFRGNQLAFAAGVETIRIFRRDDVLGNVRRRSEQIANALGELVTDPWVRDVRGRGLMWGIELARPDDDGRPAPQLAATVQTQALRRGLIVERGGREDAVIRILPPLNVTADVIDTATTILVDVVQACTSKTFAGSTKEGV